VVIPVVLINSVILIAFNYSTNINKIFDIKKSESTFFQLFFG